MTDESATNAPATDGKRRPAWGRTFVLDEGPQFRIKRVEIDPGKQMTLHMHHHRSEHWVVMAGTIAVVFEDGDDHRIINTGESTYVPPCTPHRLLNPGVLTAQLLEVQSGEYLGENDMNVVDFTPYELKLS